jgi:hypothetical protein
MEEIESVLQNWFKIIESNDIKKIKSYTNLFKDRDYFQEMVSV